MHVYACDCSSFTVAILSSRCCCHCTVVLNTYATIAHTSKHSSFCSTLGGPLLPALRKGPPSQITTPACAKTACRDHLADPAPSAEAPQALQYLYPGPGPWTMAL